MSNETPLYLLKYECVQCGSKCQALVRKTQLTDEEDYGIYAEDHRHFIAPIKSRLCESCYYQLRLELLRSREVEL